MSMIERYRASLSPAFRGGSFYLGYWGILGIYLPFMNVVFIRHGLNGSEIGVLATLLPIMTLVAAPPLAVLADRRGWRVRIVTIGVIAVALSLLLLGLGRTFLTLLPLMLLLALARSPVGPIGDSLVARMAAQHRLDYGKLRLWGSLSFALAAAGGGVLWQRVGFEAMFLVSGLLLLPVAIAAALLEERPPDPARPRGRFRDWAGNGDMLALLGASFLLGGSIGMALIFEGVLMDHLGGSESMVGLFLGISALSELPAMHYGAAISRRFGGQRTLLLSYAILTLAFAGFALAWSPWVLVVIGVVRGLGFGLFFVSTVQAVQERVPDEWSSSAQAVMNAASWGLAPLLAGPLSGLLFDAYGPQAVFVACAVAIVLGAGALVSGPLWGMLLGRRRTIHP